MKKLKSPSVFLATIFLFFITSNAVADINPLNFSMTPADQTAAGAFNATYGQEMQMQGQILENQLMEQQLAQERQTEDNTAKNQLIVLYSQNKRPVFLGCLNCADNSSYSTHNPSSQFGSKHGKFSIYNPHSIYGSSHSDYSPCNPHALYPPVIVNQTTGVKYGLLTLNTRIYGAITTQDLLYNLKKNVCEK